MLDRVWHKHYDPATPAEIEFEELPLPAFLERSVQRFGNRPMLHFMNFSMTYAEFAAAKD